MINMSNPTDVIYTHTRESAQRFEYFLLGISVGLCAYVGQTLKSEKLGFSPYTFQVVSLVILFLSIIAGFRRVEMMIATAGLNYELVALQAQMSRLLKHEFAFDHRTGVVLNDFQKDYAISGIVESLPRWERKLERVRKAEGRYYLCQKFCLAFGFLGLTLARILTAYFSV